MQAIEADDDELMARYVSGDAAAFDALYGRYKDRTWRYFLRQLGEERARDAQQDAWLKIVDRRAQYRPQGRFAAYLFSVARSVLVDAQRKTMTLVEQTLDTDELPAAGAGEPRRAARLERLAAAISAALGRLPIDQRDAFVMQQEAGLSYADIATATGASVETVKSRLRYARGKLADALAQEMHDVEF
ncbi:MAG: sigma-70 family RNA polymerase sigma factor [Pseudomonadota bacterium]